MARPRVLIVGASGFLGANLALAARHDHDVVAHSSSTPVTADGLTSLVADLAPVAAGRDLVLEAGADLVVNCAALADVDACEHDPDRARRLNADLAGELAEGCRARGSRLIHISSDAVFGQGAPPFLTTSAPSPVNEYGRSKLEGERQVLAALPSALVARTNIVGWSPTGRRSLLEFFHDRLAAGTSVSGFTDVTFRPVAASDLWSVLTAVLATGHTGLWHATGRDLLSKFDFGVQVAATFGFPAELVEPSTVAAAGLAAARANELDVRPSGQDDPRLSTSISEGLVRLRALEASGYRRQLASLIEQEATTP